MLNFTTRLAALSAVIPLLLTTAIAQGAVVITQQKALAGNVTPGDAPGFPVTLSRPGAYALGGNISASPGKVGIQIAARSVSLDLNGFELNGGGVATFGIFGGQHSATIKNGTIADFKFDGIFGTGFYWVVENVRALENGRDGVAAKTFLRIQNSTVAQNSGDGIQCTEACHVEGNVVSSNNGVGVRISVGTVLGNTITANGSYGIAGDGGAIGYGNNTLAYNLGGTSGTIFISLHPNACNNGVCP